MKASALLLFFFPLCLWAQQEVKNVPKPVTVAGRIVTTTSEPLPGANIKLISEADTLKWFGISSGNDGSFKVSVPSGLYELRVSYMGYRPYKAEVDASSPVTLPDIDLKESRNMLGAVTVTARTVTYNSEGYVANIAQNKQLQQLPLDRMLAFLPGMHVEKEKIKLYLREVNTVYINDRPVRLSGEELINHLKAYDGKNIQKIEVIVNNGVEHAASAFGGSTIRITTVKVIEGGMVSAGAGFTYSKNNHQYGNPYGNMTWRYDDWSFSLNTNAKTYFRNENQSSQETRFFDSGMTTLTKTESKNKLPYYTPVNLSIGYDFNPNNMLTLSGSYSIYKNIDESNLSSESNTPNEAPIESHSQWYNEKRKKQASLTLDYVYKVENGRLSASASYGKAWDEQRQESEILSNAVSNMGFTNGNYDDETYRADVKFEQKYKNNKEKLKLGASFSSWSNHSHTVAEQYADDILQQFGSYTDLYRYREQNYALFASYDFNWKRMNLQMGLRLEHLRVSPESQVNPERNHKSNYTNLFPNVMFNYTINPEKGHNLNLTYARTINTPYMNELNPAIIWQNEYTYSTGNPYLEPTFGHQVDMRMNFFNNYTFVMQYVDKKIRQTVYGEDDNGLLFSLPQNGGRVQSLGTELGANIMSIKKLMLNASAAYYYNRASYGGKVVNSSAWGFQVMADYQLPWNLNLSTFVVYTIPEKGVYETRQDWWMCNVDLNKTFDNWTIGLNYGFVSKIDNDIYTPDYSQTIFDGRSPHSFRLNIRYTFKWGEWFKARQGGMNNVLNRLGNDK